MNKDWSDAFDSFKTKLTKTDFKEGIYALLKLRESLYRYLLDMKEVSPYFDYVKRPLPKDKGYASKTIAYSIYHMYRIEDIVLNILIKKQDKDIYLKNDYQTKIGSSIITTGNELEDEEITCFSVNLNIDELYKYIDEVYVTTNKYLSAITYEDLKTKFTEEDKLRIKRSNVLAKDSFLLDYWCSKDLKGLLLMPFSRHLISHTNAIVKMREAIVRNKKALAKKAKKNIDLIAPCGFSCTHCFLSDFCGGCRSNYNVCSYATIHKDNLCPNFTCSKEKGLDGCYECIDIFNCKVGFYNTDDSNAPKSQAIFIKRHGKEKLKEVLDKLHEEYEFSKIQEILKENLDNSVTFLEKYI